MEQESEITFNFEKKQTYSSYFALNEYSTNRRISQSMAVTKPTDTLQVNAHVHK